MYNYGDYTKKRIRGDTIRTVKGILLSLLLHLLVLLLFVVTFKEVVSPPHSGKEKKISLNLSQFVPPPAPKPIVTPPIPKPQPIVEKPIKKPVKKEVTPTPVVKKKLLDEKKRLVAEKKESKESNVTKTASVISEKEKKILKKQPEKEVVKRVAKHKTASKIQKIQREKVRKSKDPLANALMGAGSAMYPQNRPSSSNNTARVIKQLYGREFNSFTTAQKKFIKENLGVIHRITQRTLTQNGYPTIAIHTRQQGTNVVSFYLHPNGDITGLRLKTRIGYTALDENTLKVIRIAYKDYPRPKSKTKILFYVKYSLY